MHEIVIRTSHPQPVGEHFSPARLVRTLWANRGLISSFASRELMERHKGAILGVGWNILSPLLTLAVFTIVFGYMFGMRWERGNLPPHLDFPLTFFCGQALFAVFAESASRAPTLVSGRPNLVRKVVFPLEILPVTVVWAGVMHALISLAILLVLLVGFTGTLHWQTMFLPLVLVPLVMLSLGVTWVLSAIGVFLRDVRHIVIVLVQLLMFMTPLFYRLDRLEHLPENLAFIRGIIEHNPLHVIVENGRRVVLWGEMPQWGALGVVTVFSAAVMVLGHGVFAMLRRSMADVH